MAVMQPYFRF